MSKSGSATRRRAPTRDRRRTEETESVAGKPWLWLIFVIATAVAYYPALHGQFLWDDRGHITRPDLQTVSGLWRIWFEPGATQQYYPVAHTAFWIQHRLWGEGPMLYHLVNMVLHATSAYLLWRVLRRLAVPGAWLAAALFLLHPIEVESVAWISELKNTLSGVLFLAAALVYFEFEEKRTSALYIAASALFGLAVLTKTVTAVLPVALLVIRWWKRGTVHWTNDIRPLVPWFCFGVAAGSLTAWVEHNYIGARGREFALSLLDRVVLAGRVLWFYLAKICWPTEFLFNYPRWQVSASDWFQLLSLFGALAVVVLCWMIRRWSRAPFTVAVLYVLALAPALGFVNVFPFRYSYVADHFQYLAGIPILAAAAALITVGIQRVPAIVQAWLRVALVVVVGLLGIQTWRQSSLYRDDGVLFAATLERNPTCWLCQSTLATRLLDGEGPDEWRASESRFLAAIKISPDAPEPHDGRGVALQKLERFEEAVVEHERALELAPGYAQARTHLVNARVSLGDAFSETGRYDMATAQFEQALHLDPRSANSHRGLGQALRRAGHADDAQVHLIEAVRLDPTSPAIHDALASLYRQQGRLADAVDEYRQAVRLAPGVAAGHNNLGSALLEADRPADAVSAFRDAVRTDPNLAVAHRNLGVALAALGQFREALAELEIALRLQPDNTEIRLRHEEIRRQLGR